MLKYKCSSYTLRLAFLIALTSCERDVKDENYIVSTNGPYGVKGILFADCDQNPKTGVTIYLKNDQIDISTVTDGNGNFEFAFIPAGSENLSIHYRDTNLAVPYTKPLITGIPGDNTTEDLEVYINPQSNLDVFIEIREPYTELDTLFITRDINFQVAGPFEDGLLLSVNPFYHQVAEYDNIQIELEYKINRDGERKVSAIGTSEFCQNPGILLKLY